MQMIRVRAVGARLYPYPGQPGRYIGRTRDANRVAVPEGELVEFSSDIHLAIQQGDLELVSDEKESD